MYSNSNWQDEDRINSLNNKRANQILNKRKKKEQRNMRLKWALKGVLHQIKITLLIIAIVFLAIVFLCAIAWYILELDEEKLSTIQSIMPK